MLSELYIKNLAVIEEAAIPFTDDFNAFTGETGAGKSILINGINAVLGQRVTKDIVRTGCDRAVVSALFTELSKGEEDLLEEMGISHDDGQLSLSREIMADGESSARVNGLKSSVAVLREIGQRLVNIHGQHDNQLLLNTDRHLGILDSYGGLSEMRSDYHESFRLLQEASRRLKKLTVQRRERLERQDILRERVETIGALELSEGEDEELEKEYRAAGNSGEILRRLSEVCLLLHGDDDDTPNTEELIASACDSLNGAAEQSGSESLANLAARLESARVELADIAYEAAEERDRVDVDPARLEYLSDRLSEINRLKKKYCGGLSDVIKVYEEAAAELAAIESSDSEIEAAAAERERLLAEVSEKAKALSAARAKAAAELSEQVERELSFLDMPDVTVKAKMEKGKLTATGLDSVEFMISANAGEELKPLSKIASGGELSRIMLALKSVISEKDDVHTLIFDEIDTGVSGRAAQKIGIKLAEVSRRQQVICVTHLSQMAVMADNHLLIEKSTSGGRTFTQVRRLDEKGRKNEIARIMVGENITDTALKNASEMLSEARERKEKMK
ncbi:MAG: DNA repair protein RecN [Ruminococcus sp.]|nr:DNA repair protein RecN [Ruminococcus sp.]